MAIDRDRADPPLNRDEPPAAKDADGLRASPFTEDVFDDEYYGRRRRGGGISFTLIAAVVFLAAIVAAAGWYILGERSNSATTSGGDGNEMVRADPGPYKIKPEDPGGLQVDNQDKLIYDRVAKGAPPSRVENLLPAPEVPRAPPVKAPEAAAPAPAASTPPPPAAAPAAPAEDSMAKLMAEVENLNKTPAPSVPAPIASAPAAVPEKAPAPQPPSATVAPAPAAPAAVPASTPGAPTLLVPAAPPEAAPSSPAPATPAPAPAVAQAASTTAPTPAVSSAAPAGASTGMSIQLASARSEEAAMGEWKRINGKNSDLLTGLAPSVVQAEVPDKGTFFRLRAGPLADKPTAEALCASLAARNVSCIVVRP